MVAVRTLITGEYNAADGSASANVDASFQTWIDSSGFGKKRIGYFSNVDAFIMRANCFTNVLLAVNSSVNFIIYFIVGNKFREILVSECLCKASRQKRLSGRAISRFLQPPESGSAAGFTSDDVSFFGTADRRDGFVWSSRRSISGRGLAPRSPTTEPGAWQRTTIADELAVPCCASGPFGTTSVVELEICPRVDTAQTLQTVVPDEETVDQQLSNDVTVDTSEMCQCQSD